MAREQKEEIDEYLQHHDIGEIIERKIEQTPIKNKWKEYEGVRDNKNEDASKDEEDSQYVLQLPDDFKKNRRRGRKKKKYSTTSSDRNYKNQITEKSKDKCNEYYEPPTKRIKNNPSQTSNLGSMHTQRKQNEKDDEWNWDLWENENELNQRNQTNGFPANVSRLSPNQKIATPELKETQKTDTQTDLRQTQHDKIQMDTNTNGSFVGLIGFETPNTSNKENEEIQIQWNDTNDSNINTPNIHKAAKSSKWSEYM